MKAVKLVLSWMFLGLCGAAAAEEDLTNLDLEALMKMEVKVTSQKRLQNIDDVPASIVAFSEKDLEAACVQDASQLRALVPGLVFDNTAGFSLVYLRGIGSDFFSPGVNHSVAVYVDGIYTPFNQVMDQSFLDVERVEVMRGPQGTLYGRNATAGAINVITRKPGDAPGMDLSAEAMNFNGWGMAARAAGPVSEHLNASLSFEQRTRDSWVSNPQGPQIEDAERRNVRGKLHYHTDAGIEAELGLHYLSSDRPEMAVFNQFLPNSAGAFASLVTGGLVPNGQQSDQRGVVPTNVDTLNEALERGASLRVRAPFAAFDLVSVSGLRDVSVAAGVDFDATSAPLAFFEANRMTDQLFTQELQLVSNRDSRMDWLVGAYFFDSSSAHDILTLPSLTGGVDTMYNASDATAYAVFADATYRFNASWALIAGGRYSREEVEHQPIRINGVAISAPADVEWSDFSPRLGIQYSVGEHRLYATVSRGFKSGSFNLTNPTDLAAVDPETLIAAELGWKTRLPQYNLRFEAALFNYDYKDLQVGFVESALSPTALRNADKAVVRGVDLAVSANPAERLNLRAGMSWLAEAEYKEYSNGSAFLPAPIGFAIAAADFSGNRMMRTPELTFNVGLDYTQPLTAGRVMFSGGWYYSDSYFFSAQNTAFEKQGAFDLLNAQVTFEPSGERWRISAWGKNLTDASYLCSKSANAFGIIGCYAEPRTYGVQIAYRFRSQPQR